MHKVLILGLIVLSGCSTKAQTYNFFCATPMGGVSGEGGFADKGANVVIKTETGDTVIIPWTDCLAAVKK